MKIPNDDLRQFAKTHHVFLWQLAEAMSIADTTLSKLLRHELPPERKEEMYAQIRKISAESRA